MYTRVGARKLLESVDSSRLSDTPDSEAAELRQSALVSMRNRGGDAERAAALITRTFPPDTRAVPVYLERALVDGREALLMVEAWGPRNASLSLERLWILDATSGEIIDSAATH